MDIPTSEDSGNILAAGRWTKAAKSHMRSLRVLESSLKSFSGRSGAAQLQLPKLAAALIGCQVPFMDFFFFLNEIS